MIRLYPARSFFPPISAVIVKVLSPTVHTFSECVNMSTAVYTIKYKRQKYNQQCKKERVDQISENVFRHKMSRDHCTRG